MVEINYYPIVTKCRVALLLRNVYMCGVPKHKKLICILWLLRVYKLDPCRPAALKVKNSMAALVNGINLDFEARRNTEGQSVALLALSSPGQDQSLFGLSWYSRSSRTL